MADPREARRVWEELQFRDAPGLNKVYAVWCPVCLRTGEVVPTHRFRLKTAGAFIDGQVNVIRESVYAVPCPTAGCPHEFEFCFLTSTPYPFTPPPAEGTKS